MNEGYAEYLLSEHWAQLRKDCFGRWRCRCAICGAGPHDLDVHHLEYRRLYDVTVDDVRPVCRPCHDSIHTAARASRMTSRAAFEWVLKQWHTQAPKTYRKPKPLNKKEKKRLRRERKQEKAAKKWANRKANWQAFVCNLNRKHGVKRVQKALCVIGATSESPKPPPYARPGAPPQMRAA